MSSFSCPYIVESGYCIKIKVECIPGRKGCVLDKKVEFTFPIEKRKQKDKAVDPFKNYRRNKK
jgi:hypothetical protein